jgi:hypothetical protein
VLRLEGIINAESARSVKGFGVDYMRGLITVAGESREQGLKGIIEGSQLRSDNHLLYRITYDKIYLPGLYVLIYDLP